jgi:hypothetical protein
LTLTDINLSGINAGIYATAVAATFAGDATVSQSQGIGQLAVAKATSLLQVVGGTFSYDGQPHPAMISVTGVNNSALAPLTTLYNGSNSLPVDAGTYAITAAFAGNQNYNFVTNNQQSIIIGRADQAIIFGALTSRTYGEAPFTISATGGASGNAVTFNSQTPVTCSLSGNTVTILYAGTCTVPKVAFLERHLTATVRMSCTASSHHWSSRTEDSSSTDRLKLEEEDCHYTEN